MGCSTKRVSRSHDPQVGSTRKRDIGAFLNRIEDASTQGGDRKWRLVRNNMSLPLHLPHTSGDKESLDISDKEGEEGVVVPTSFRKYFALLPTKSDIAAMFNKLESAHKQDTADLRDGLQSFHCTIPRRLAGCSFTIPDIFNSPGSMASGDS